MAFYTKRKSKSSSKRKEKRQKLLALQSAVLKANQLTDPLEPFPEYRRFCKHELEVELGIKKVGQLESSLVSSIFDLMKRNMQDKYEECSWGWNDDRKLSELTDSAAWYLIAQTCDGRMVGFSHFRFDMDYGFAVLYCYELQLEPTVQGKGLGKFMMHILESVAFKNHMQKVVLTVLKHNSFSQFFKALNYKIDTSSPVESEGQTYPYEILSKKNSKT